MEDFYEASQFDKNNLDNNQNKFFTSKKDLNSILYGIQYNSFNLLFTFAFGSVLEIIFPLFDPKKSNLSITFEIIFQAILISIIIHYIKKINNKIPFFLGDINNVNKKVSLDIMITIVFICTQVNFLKKIQHLSKKGVNYINNLLKPKPKIPKNKKDQIRKMVKHILNKDNNQQNQVRQTHQLNQITNQIQQVKQMNKLKAHKNHPNTLIPMPKPKGNFSDFSNNVETFTGNNFHKNFPNPQNSMDQNTNLNQQMDYARQANGYQSNMNSKDINNLLSGIQM